NALSKLRHIDEPACGKTCQGCSRSRRRSHRIHSLLSRLRQSRSRDRITRSIISHVPGNKSTGSGHLPIEVQTMSANHHHYDVIIIGSGAGGGTLAYRLAPSGKKILLLECGDFVPREKQNWDSRAVVGDGRYNNVEPWRDVKGNEFVPGAHYFVGGNTKFYGAALVRLRKKDFGELRHHGGISPAWPLKYEDLEPYYTEAEYLYQVHGVRGEDPTEPPASKPYRFPPVRHELRIQQLSDDLKKLGHRPFHLPIGVLLDEQNPHK